MGYVKLKGHEKPTPESERRARAFMRWFSLRLDVMRKEWVFSFNDEAATDAALYIYDSIALKGLHIKGKYKHYFLRAYHMRVLVAHKKRAERLRKHVYIDDPEVVFDLPASDFNSAEFEATVEALNSKMLNYVRDKYPPLDVSLFEIYIALQPEMSYKKLGKMLGYPPNKIWPVIGAIRRDLSKKFEGAALLCKL